MNRPTINIQGKEIKLKSFISGKRYVNEMFDFKGIQSIPTDVIPFRYRDAMVKAKFLLSNQPEGDCVGFACKQAEEIQDIINGRPYTPYSAEFIYTQGKMLEGQPITNDNGLETRDGAWVSKYIGMCAQSLCPDDGTWFGKASTMEQLNDAVSRKNTWFYNVLTVPGMLKVMADKWIPRIGVPLFDSIEGVKSDGIIPMPQAGEAIVGCHDMTLADVTMLSGKPYFSIPQTWGEEVGDYGWMYLPFYYFPTVVNTFNQTWDCYISTK